MLKLYSFYWDCGRNGGVEGLFIADSELVESMIGKRVYFGEILGKHSEVYGDLETKDLTVLSEDEEKIKWLKELFQSVSISGYNPLNYIRIDCSHCGEPVCEGGDWYRYKIIDGEYYCEGYNEETLECEYE